MQISVREAQLKDVPEVTMIYNQGIEDRIATLETRLRAVPEMEEWLTSRSPRHKVLVAVRDDGTVLGWASLNLFNARACYSGVADISVYVSREMRGQGLGRKLLHALEQVAIEHGFHKLVLSTFRFNSLGQGLYKGMGFREVGTYEKQGLLDGSWVDVTIMEKLL